MKIELNHDLDDVNEIIDGIIITDSIEDEQNIKEILKRFNVIFQAFDIGMLVSYLSIKEDSEIRKMSQVIQVMVNDLGWEKFKTFFNIVEKQFERTISELEESREDSEAV